MDIDLAVGIRPSEPVASEDASPLDEGLDNAPQRFGEVFLFLPYLHVIVDVLDAHGGRQLTVEDLVRDMHVLVGDRALTHVPLLSQVNAADWV